MSKENILVVKTGRSGAKLSQLFTTEIECEGRNIQLSGKTRLVGNWYRSVVSAVKQRGISGTFSVFVHDEDDTEELINEYQKLLIKLGKGVDWHPVARLKMSMNELSAITNESNDRAYAELAENKFIEYTSMNRFRFVSKPRTNAEINECRLYVKNFVADRSAVDIANKLEII
jgi:hypothetical protein